MGDIYGAPGKLEDIRAVLKERKEAIKIIKAKSGIGIKVDNRVVVGGGGIIDISISDKAENGVLGVWGPL